MLLLPLFDARRRVSARLGLLGLAFLAPVLAASADPLLTGWFTANSGKYARIYQTAAAETAGTTSTTWSRGQGTQTLPVYSDISEVNSSANWVYIRTSNLPSHLMGPWYLDAAKTQLFPNYPSNRAEVYRFPRVPVIPATKTATTGGTTGKAVNGVSLFDARDALSYINSTGVDGTVGGAAGDGIWNRDAYFNESVTFDPALAHQAGPQYHYHAQPIGLRHQLGDNVSYNAATNRYSENTAAATAHSPILGWARDGLPVYGPYGYSSPLDPASGIRRMVSGYALRDGANGTTAITVRQILPAWAQRFQNRATLTANQYGPAVNATYALGRYIEDYAYRGDLGQTQGVDFDLNEYNVRWCVTPEYPSGTYAYFTPIKADGTPMYPYTTGRQYFGTPSGGATTAATMNADTPLTRQATGGPSQALAIPSTPTVSSGVVSVAWTAVEGATYAVAASTDNTAYTTKAAGLVATGTTRAATYSALSTGGTEYTRVTRTALPSYDTNGFSAATVAQTATASFSTGPLNTAPTLNNVENLSGALAGEAFSITYAAVAAVANEADANGDTLAFRVESLGVGTLTKTGAPVAVGALLSAGESFVWTPAADASGNLVPFTFVAWDGALASSPAVNLTVNVTIPAPSFARFQAAHFTAAELLEPAVSGDDADPDADGLANLLEYAFDLDPRATDASGAISATVVSDRLEFSYLRRTDDVNEELSYDVESSSDLVTWDATFANLEEVSAVPVPGTAVERVTVRDLTPLDSGVRRFLRLRVSQN